ncbi:MAG: hypothetical protein IJN32_06360, partial [Thermoguttaceae bacterium]|nr:hypothetical protein [Thermoguttaceae bacterium]
MNVDEIFRQALLNRIGERRFSYWFAGARFSASPSGLIIRVENEFLCAFIRSSFQHELQKICVDVAGVELPIEICCDEAPASASPTPGQAPRRPAPVFPAQSSPLPVAPDFAVPNGTSSLSQVAPQPAKKRGRPRKNPLPQDAERSNET